MTLINPKCRIKTVFILMADLLSQNYEQVKLLPILLKNIFYLQKSTEILSQENIRQVSTNM